MVYTRPIRRPLTFREPRKPANCAIRATIDPEMSRGELGHEGWWSRQKILSPSPYTDNAREKILNFYYITQWFTILLLNLQRCCSKPGRGIFLTMNFPIMKGMSRFCVVAPLR
jgi:hypothetical protein